MKAKKIYENFNFERNIDPKIPMRIGLNSKSFHVIDVEREVTEEDDGLVRDYNEDLSEDEILDLFQNWSKYDDNYFTGIIFFVLAPDLDPIENDGDEEIFLALDLNNKWIEYKGNHYYLSNDNLNESYNFEKGKPLKKSLGIGAYETLSRNFSDIEDTVNYIINHLDIIVGYKIEYPIIADDFTGQLPPKIKIPIEDFFNEGVTINGVDFSGEDDDTSIDHVISEVYFEMNERGLIID